MRLRLRLRSRGQGPPRVPQVAETGAGEPGLGVKLSDPEKNLPSRKPLRTWRAGSDLRIRAAWRQAET